MTTVAEFIVSQLAEWGVRHIYGVVGDTLFALSDAIARDQRIRFVAVRHEAAAGFMASAEAKLTGRLGACIATSGPGIANLLNGLGDAWADRSPVLALTGQVETKKIGTDAKQYIDQQSLMRPLAGYTALLTHPDAIGDLLPMAMRTALGEGRVGHLSLPKDLLGAPCAAAVAPPEPFLGAPPVADPSVIAGAVAQMNQARRPLILMGQGARPAGPALLELAERWGAGMLQSLPAKGAVPFSHPLVLGGLGEGGTTAGHAALREADLLLTAGCNWWPQKYVPEGIPVIKVDRDPLNVGKPMAVRYGIAGDVRAVIPALAQGVTPSAAPDWTARLRALKQEWLTQVERETGAADSALSPQQVMSVLEAALPADALICLDTGDHTVWFNRIFGGTHHEVLVSGTWRSIGFGLPAALAAKLAQPDRTVVAVVGDASLQSLMGELVTAAEVALPVTVIVMNNGMMAIEYNRTLAQGYNPLGTRPRNPDFAALAAACSLEAHQARSATALQEALSRALASNGPTLIDTHISAPMAPTAQA